MDETAETPVADRRALLAKGGVAAAVAAAAAVGLGRSAEAANGGNLVIGQANTGTLPTTLTGGSSLRVTDGTDAGGGQIGSVIGERSTTDGNGVVGVKTGPGFGSGVLGLSTAAFGTGVTGLDFSGNVNGCAVFGVADGTGVEGNGDYDDLRASGSGRITLATAGVSTPPAEFGELGMLARDDAGNLWYCFSEAGDGVWRKVAGGSTAGAFHAISPVRVYDSRIAAIPQSGQFTANANKLISVKDARHIETGGITTANAVPAGATAIAYNLTVTATGNAGFLFIAPGTATPLTASSINWSGPGTTVANGGTVALDTQRQVKIFCGGPGATAHAILDVTGYYM